MNIALIGNELGQAAFSFAMQAARRQGFTWAAVPDAEAAPYNLAGIQKAATECHIKGGPFPVWAGGSDDTIYGLPHLNHAFRFWHDMLHLDQELDVSLEDELRLGAMHVEQVKRMGYSRDHQTLMWIDTIGQSLYNYIVGEFPRDQMQFAKDVVGLMMYGATREGAVRTIATAHIGDFG